MATEDRCGACGERNPPAAEFCVLCGTYLGWNKHVQDVSTEPAATPPTPPEAVGASSAPPHPVTPSVEVGGGAACTQCLQINPPSRRFCSRCGQPLLAGPTMRPVRPDEPHPTGSVRRRARAARSEYRRSLPALYRWRRVVVVLAIVLAVGAALTLTGNNPIGWARDRWRDLTADLVPVDGVAATAVPPESVPPPYDVAALPRPRAEAWATGWDPDRPLSDECGEEGSADGEIVLSWPRAVRVRGLDVWAGLEAADSDRETQYRPRVLGVSWSGGCQRVSLDDTADKQRLEIDTRASVDSLTISVDDAAPPDASTAGPQLVAIGGIEVLQQAD